MKGRQTHTQSLQIKTLKYMREVYKKLEIMKIRKQPLKVNSYFAESSKEGKEEVMFAQIQCYILK